MNPTPTASASTSTSSSPVPTTASAATAAGDDAIRSGDFKAQYDRFAPMVSSSSVADDDLEFFRGEKAIVLRNVTIGVHSFEAELDRIRTVLPTTPIAELMELPDLAKALFYAVTLVSDPISAREIEERTRRVSTGRKELLRTAEILARRGLFPAERVAAIQAGRGRLDSAADAVALAGLFTEFQARVAGKHVFTRDEIEQIGKDGEWLSQQLNPRGARKEVRPGAVTPRVVRDRLYAEIVRRHTELRRVGTYLWGNEVDRYVPKLSSRLLGGRPAASDVAAAVGVPAAAPASSLPTA